LQKEYLSSRKRTTVDYQFSQPKKMSFIEENNSNSVQNSVLNDSFFDANENGRYDLLSNLGGQTYEIHESMSKLRSVLPNILNLDEANDYTVLQEAINRIGYLKDRTDKDRRQNVSANNSFKISNNRKNTRNLKSVNKISRSQ